MGTDTSRRLRRCGALGVAALAALAVGASSASATTPARPYISVQDVVVNVGQHGKLVVTYGNLGERTLRHVRYGCAAVAWDGSVAFRQLTYDTYRSPLRPGQNANFEKEWIGRRVGSGTRIQCTISGVEASTNRLRFSVSSVVTIRVNP